MHVTIFHSHFASLGGAEILLTTQARWLTAAGHNVRIVALQVDRGFVAQHLAEFRVEEIGLPKGCSKIQALKRGAMPELIERAQPYLRDTDVVLAYNYPAAPITAAAAPNARRVWYACEPYRALYLNEANPVTVANAQRVGVDAHDLATRTIARRMRRRRLRHALLPWTAIQEQALKSFDGAGVRALDGVASLSHYGASCVKAATGRVDVGVMYPMVRFARVASPRAGIRRDAPQILAQTRLEVPKNIDTLIRAAAIVRRSFRHAVLHVVGSGGGRAALEKIAEHTAPGSVRFHGFLSNEDLDALSAACDIFALVPVDEPFGMVFPEAASRGLLLVGPDHGGPREILEDGDIGELCDPYDAESIAAGILRTLALSDAEANARRMAADASVRARFHPDLIGQQLELVLRG